MPGTLVIPNIIGAQPGPDVQANLFDQNWDAIKTYVNIRQLTQNTLAARPPIGSNTAPDGTFYFATDVNAGTLYGSNGVAWTQLARGLAEPVPQPGALVSAGTLAGDQSGAYTTTSATYVDVDPTNLKVTVNVPIGALFIIVFASYSLTAATNVVSGQDCVRIMAAGLPTGPYSYCGPISATTVQSVFGVRALPPSGPQDVSLQFRGDGVNTVAMSNPASEGYTAIDAPEVVPRMLVLVTT